MARAQRVVFQPHTCVDCRQDALHFDDLAPARDLPNRRVGVIEQLGGLAHSERGARYRIDSESKRAGGTVIVTATERLTKAYKNLASLLLEDRGTHATPQQQDRGSEIARLVPDSLLSFFLATFLGHSSASGCPHCTQ